MAIQHRRGAATDFFPEKMLAGEFALTTDGTKQAWIAFGPGDVKRIAFTDDILDAGYYFPVIDAEGNLSWMASKDGMLEPAKINIKGPEGKKGDQGVGIESIDQDISQSPNGINKLYIMTTDGKRYEFNILNGSKGDTGKTAYEYAKDGGYTGTEEEFSAKLAKEYPTKLSELENDTGFIKNTVADLANYYLKTETYSQEEINQKLSAIPKFSIVVVDSLPITGEEATVYLVRSGEDGNNLYAEYIYVDGVPEYLGSQTVDLSGYALKEEIPAKLTELTNDAGFITNTVSNLVNYYSKTEIDNKGYLTEHQDLSGYAKKSTTLAGYGITDGATKAEVEAIPRPEVSDTEPTAENVNLWIEPGTEEFALPEINDETVSAVDTWSSKKIDSKLIGKVDKTGASLGIASDGLIYLFIDGLPTGTGIPQGQSGDIFGYVDENNTIVLTGNLADGTYALKYEMENGEVVDIGDMVLGSNVYYQITKNLTNCTTNNSVLSIAEGESYSATILANDGYWISSIVVTMGGTDITSSAVSGGNINIAEVTGNIVINAVAEESGPAYTNQIPLSTDAGGNLFNGGQGWKTGYRLSLSDGGETAISDYECTGFIPAKLNDTIRVKDIDLTEENSTNIVVYDSNKQPTKGTASTHGTSLYNLFVTYGTEENGVYTATLSNSIHGSFTEDVAYIRIGSKSITDDSILTVNQEIV